MRYLESKDGLVSINKHGEPITLGIGHRVKLVDKRGNRLFAYRYTYNGVEKEVWEDFKVSDLLDDAIVLDADKFHLVLAVQTVSQEPLITHCEGQSFSNDRILTVEFAGCSATFQITPSYLPQE